MSDRHGSGRLARPDQPVVLADDTYLPVLPETVKSLVGDPARWRQWWPYLELDLRRDRGTEGCVWAVGGHWVGEMEVWLEPAGQGTVVHWQVRAAVPAARRMSRRRLERDTRGRVLAWKAHMFDLQDSFKPVKGRPRDAERGRDERIDGV